MILELYLVGGLLLVIGVVLVFVSISGKAKVTKMRGDTGFSFIRSFGGALILTCIILVAIGVVL